MEIPIHPNFLNGDESQNEPQNKINVQIIEPVKENNHISRKEMAEKYMEVQARKGIGLLNKFFRVSCLNFL